MVTQMSKAAEFIQSIAHLPIDQQIMQAKLHVRGMSFKPDSTEVIEFFNDPAVSEWVKRNVDAIHAVIPFWWTK